MRAGTIKLAQPARRRRAHLRLPRPRLRLRLRARAAAQPRRAARAALRLARRRAVPTVEVARHDDARPQHGLRGAVPPDDKRAVGRRHCQLEERDGELYLRRPRQRRTSRCSTASGSRRRSSPPATASPSSTTPSRSTRGPVDATTADAPPPRWRPRPASTTSRSSRSPARALRRLAAHDAALPRRAARRSRARSRRPAARGCPPTRRSSRELVELNLYNSQNTLLIDLDRCTRCDECVRACADAHGGVARFTRDGPRFGKYLVTHGLPLLHRSEVHDRLSGRLDPARTSSLEIRIEDWCIGCQRCANQCPFGNINMVELAQGPAPWRSPRRSSAQEAGDAARDGVRSVRRLRRSELRLRLPARRGDPRQSGRVPVGADLR